MSKAGSRTYKLMNWLESEKQGNRLGCWNYSEQKYIFVKTHRIVYLKLVRFIIYKLYLNKVDFI